MGDRAEVEEMASMYGLADTFADISTGYDDDGPFAQEPDSSEADHPKAAKNITLQAAATSTWGSSFCSAHHVGWWCNGYTRIRCCQGQWGGIVKCGTTRHASACGWHGPARPGGVWHIHPGWHVSSSCESRPRTGFFCRGHRTVHCCNDYGHWVECTTRREATWGVDGFEGIICIFCACESTVGMHISLQQS